MNTLIIEDEHHSAEALKVMLNDYCPDIRLNGICHSVEQGIKALSRNNTQLVFLDIMLQDGNGFELLSHFKNYDFGVIFTTAYDQYAIKAIKYSALDYLLKPINLKELMEAVEKVKMILKNSYPSHLKHLVNNTKKGKLRQIALATLQGYSFVEIDSIVRFEADGAYTKVFLLNKDHHLLSQSLKHYEELLTDESFFRIHHSHFINLNMIRKYEKGSGGLIVMKDGSKVTVASRRKEELMHVLNLH